MGLRHVVPTTHCYMSIYTWVYMYVWRSVGSAVGRAGFYLEYLPGRLYLDNPIHRDLNRPHEHQDLTFCFEGPRQSGYQTPLFVGSFCLSIIYHLRYTRYHIPSAIHYSPYTIDHKPYNICYVLYIYIYIYHTIYRRLYTICHIFCVIYLYVLIDR